MMLFLAAVLIVGAGLFYWADRNVHHGIYWADRLCHEAQILCDAPWWLLVAATAMIHARTVPTNAEVVGSRLPRVISLWRRSGRRICS
jgi:hypothetical protein